LTGREGKSIGLAFFLVVAIKTNLSTFAAAKIIINAEFGMWNSEFFNGELNEFYELVRA
jgi:hypothetical protein